MRKQIDSIIQLWSEYYGVNFSSEAGDALAELVVKESTSTNSAMPKCHNPQCGITLVPATWCPNCKSTYVDTSPVA